MRDLQCGCHFYSVSVTESPTHTCLNGSFFLSADKTWDNCFFLCFFISLPFGSLCPICRGMNMPCVRAICSHSKSQSTLVCVPCHCGPGDGNTGIWDVWLWVALGLLAWSHLVFPPGHDKGDFGEHLSAGDRKDEMAVAREPGNDKVACYQEWVRDHEELHQVQCGFPAAS